MFDICLPRTLVNLFQVFFSKVTPLTRALFVCKGSESFTTQWQKNDHLDNQHPFYGESLLGVIHGTRKSHNLNNFDTISNLDGLLILLYSC